MTNKTIGIIGVGLMGHGIAINLVRKGWRLKYYRHAGNQPTDDLDALGATGIDGLAALAATSDVVVLCLNGSPQVEAVMLKESGVLEGLRPGSVVVDCSTAVPASTRTVAARVAAAGSRFMDAAMTRTPLEAEQGRLNLLIGADPALLDEMTPLLACFSENRFHAGKVGAGHALKLLHNFVSIGGVTLIAEAFACAKASGISAEVLVSVLQQGGGHGAALDRLAPYVLEGDPSRMKFSVANARKDLDYYGQFVRDAGSSHGVADGILGTLTALAAAGMTDRYLAEAPDAIARLSDD
ncbi:3-hydroxyisobutyrate dehydrogenase [Roseovarius azorensis]|uniref:3-hydroxyisobutyrate dehydrogenase n=1 Tax=Roseovarius azorensis TaxID=1287727 RepID=A0A1H7X5U8_9RHOB|nr:NAD(P)-dependent oxidoreductase [Roseovarius azorensis]SEM28508.1 3-hydroxyisobutyrate dehydrogenase [Roseovarius azorensis]